MEAKQLEKYLQQLQTDYKVIFNSDEGVRVMADLIKGDSHESAYMEGQRSVLLFIKQMLQKKDK